MSAPMDEPEKADVARATPEADAAVVDVLRAVARLFVDTAPPTCNFWTWLEQQEASDDVLATAQMYEPVECADLAERLIREELTRPRRPR